MQFDDIQYEHDASLQYCCLSATPPPKKRDRQMIDQWEPHVFFFIT